MRFQRLKNAIWIGGRQVTFGLMAAMLATACTHNTSDKATIKDATSDTLLQADAMLHQRLQAVLDADDAFAQLIMQSAATTVLDARNATIAQAEIAFQKTLDSIEKSVQKTDASNQWNQRLGYFKSILLSRRGLSDLRMVLSADSDDSTTMQHRLISLRAETLKKEQEVQEQNKKIASLERTLGHFSSIGTKAENGAAEKIGDYSEAKGETLGELKQRNKNLYMAYSSLQNKYFIVGRNYLLLKQEEERMSKELAALRQAKEK